PVSLAIAGFAPGPGLKISLFERLARRYPGVLLTLTAQYRMNAPICAVISDLFYDGALRPGDARVAGARLSDFVCTKSAGRSPHHDLWDDTPIVVLDTSRDPAARDTVRQWSKDESRDNPREAGLIADLVVDLFRRVPRERWGALASEVGVISA